MKCSRCLLRLVRSGRTVAQRGPPLLSPSSGQLIVQHNQQQQVLRQFRCSPASAKNQPKLVRFVNDDDTKKTKSLVTQGDLFEEVAKETKTKATFNQVIDVFTKRDIRRRGHVEFIYAALKKMPEFGVERDLTVYNKLLDVFPKEVFVPRNFIQRMFNHYPRQQECGVQVLEQMENYGIMPNIETKVLLVQIFGEKSHPIRKYQRIMYWFPKFKHINPFPIPQPLPEDPVDLAVLSLTRIANDLDAKTTVYQLPFTDITESGEEISFPHIVGIQSPSQMELLAKHNPNRPVFVEGPFPLWLKKTCVHYYILRADPTPPEEKEEEVYDPERCFYYPLQLDLDLDRDLGDEENFDVDNLDEGPVFAMCMSGRGDQATLNQWISGLQQNNPILGRIPTLFRLDAGTRELEGAADIEADHSHRPHPQSQREDGPPAEDPEDAVEEEEKPRRSQLMKQ
ncbi:evolutionarily conserved signaling intermediate in Toll pathway, mitochondrial [Poeciliopsis prolifica]|uniref:evolutionarily conserved signaling intermediate in Toll pathway, mitochondrial n=1 Tax=Poeciliopsis prolifica TaxID=188132 RepID=UPI002413D23C|nr:evolutionarily conserved signaling intermediate in Toll pathway, mitochondrial [Poeciliopsis prolifica]XP_054914731.1 evolutionarily conserved signaling intermediate in Toll pathway, mitochondrial [Poeciliopsis prolifica]XP_054914732.1 evolutionarily conserved signaling intermediate in Toll pathway, mitochondrial [Poeciliopsis prolifica]